MGSSRINDPELTENIDQLESNLITYEAGLSHGQDDTSQVQFIFRYAHNLKSSLGMLGYSEASALLHKVESCFDLVRNAKKRANTDLTRATLMVLDIVRENLQADDMQAFPDATAIMSVLEGFIIDETVEDMSITLPFALTLVQARVANQAVRSGQHLWLIDKLITTNIEENLFGMLPVFEQAEALGQLIDFRPHWNQIPKDKSECVLRVLIASSLDQTAFSKQIHDSFRQVRLPNIQRVYIKADLPAELPPLLEQLNFKPVNEIPEFGPSLAITGIGSTTLQAMAGTRKNSVLVLAVGDFTTKLDDLLASFDAGADAVTTDSLELEHELQWLETMFFTGMGGVV